MHGTEALDRPILTKVFVDDEKTEWIYIEQTLLEKMRLLRRIQPNPEDDAETFMRKAYGVRGANCHQTSLYLMGKLTLDELLALTNHDIETAGHKEVVSEENTQILSHADTATEFAQALEGRKPPIRVTFFRTEPDGSLYPVHSITVIGITNKGHIIGFEKMSAKGDHPFHDIDVLANLTAYLAKGKVVGIGKE